MTHYTVSSSLQSTGHIILVHIFLCWTLLNKPIYELELTCLAEDILFGSNWYYNISRNIRKRGKKSLRASLYFFAILSCTFHTCTSIAESQCISTILYLSRRLWPTIRSNRRSQGHFLIQYHKTYWNKPLIEKHSWLFNCITTIRKSRLVYSSRDRWLHLFYVIASFSFFRMILLFSWWIIEKTHYNKCQEIQESTKLLSIRLKNFSVKYYHLWSERDANWF